MNKQTKVWLNMLRTVVAFTTSSTNMAITQSVPKFFDAIQKIKTFIALIDSAIGIQTENNTGVAEFKDLVKNETCSAAVAITKPAYAWAVNTGNLSLANAINFSETTYSSWDDSVFASKMQNIIDQLLPFAPDLVDYGVPNTALPGLQASVDNFVMVSKTPREAIINRKQKTELINVTVSEALIFCRSNADSIAMAFKSTETEFYNGFRSARKLVNMPTVHTKLKTRVTDAITGAPVPLATIKINGTELSVQTDVNGMAVINEVPIGLQNVTCNAESYLAKKSLNIVFVKGHYTNCNFILTPQVVFANN